MLQGRADDEIYITFTYTIVRTPYAHVTTRTPGLQVGRSSSDLTACPFQESPSPSTGR